MVLKRLYAHNYRCLVNFEIHLDELTVLLGPNGGGKSSILDLLFTIRRLVIDNTRIHEAFPTEDCTAWTSDADQSFELELLSDVGTFTYRIKIAHDRIGRKARIDLEQLLLDGATLFEFKNGQVQLYRDDYSAGPSYPFDWTLSALATIVPRPDNTKLTLFTTWLKKLLIVQLHPMLMHSESAEEAGWLNRNGTNFASWYRYVSQEHQDKIFDLTKQLQSSLPGFHAFKLEQSGKVRLLKVGFTSDDVSVPLYFGFDHLSDGQRVLIVLYSLLFGLGKLGYTIYLDEPENYVSIEEIQPWLMELLDVCGEGIPQAVIISHHPELIDYLGKEYGRIIERDPLGPSRVRGMPARIDDLKLSEQFARGWTE